MSLTDNLQNPNDGRPFDKRLGGENYIPYNSDELKTGTSGIQDAEFETDLGKYAGVPSIMNRFSIVQFKGAYGGANELMSSLIDREGKRKWYEDFNFGGTAEHPGLHEPGYSKDVTVSKLIEWGNANTRGTTPYYFTDFAYCKYFRKVPNNYLITLRRYAVPTLDSLDFPYYKDGASSGTNGNIGKSKDPISPMGIIDNTSKTPPVAQAVTWISKEAGNSIDKLMNFSVGLSWKDLTADIWDNTEQMGDLDSDSGMGGMMKGFLKGLTVSSGETNASNFSRDGQNPMDPYENGPYQNRIKGPVNRIDSVKQRNAPLTFEQKLTLQFHYSARSIGGINTKAAMLDIIANFLVLTYGTGAFWGGANRFMGSYQAYPWKKGMAAWYRGDAVGFFDAVTDSVSKTVDRLSGVLDNLLKDPIGTLTNLAGNVGGLVMASKTRGKAPQFHGMRAILSGEPVGEWHLVVGNPLNPMMMIGNLICTGCDFSFGNELGPDDFPTEMTITVTLEHGMARDRYAVESMFNKGAGRIYTLPDGIEQNFSAAKQTITDIGQKRVDYKKDGEILQGKGSIVNDVATKDIDFRALGNTALKSYGNTIDGGTLLAAKYGLGYNTPEKKN
jgi:hypothetical protein